MISKLIKIPFLKRIIPSLLIKILKVLKKNRGYFKIEDTLMFLDFLDPIDRKIILNQEYEKLELIFLINEIKKNKILFFYDIGANCGYHSVYIAKKIPKINIFSFEPNEEAYLKFKKTLEINSIFKKKINIYNFGLSSKTSKLKMQSMIKHGYAQTGGTAIVEKDSYDQFNVFYAEFKIGDKVINKINDIIAIKIDVEGHELNVLEGLKNTLLNNKAIIQIEIFKKNYHQVHNYLLSLGYRIVNDVKVRSNYFYSNI